ncbi:MAG TPA: type II toxin-antitoxin system RelE/ParE family toxin [Bryobacteraceae bacterium]|nr:type II toxin-antitoxin system RelE/ParE family toxin [Bryobacteraceae bacterium]
MSRYVLAPAAASDLVQIWRYIRKESSADAADRVEAVIRSKIAVLAEAPFAGHWRRDLTAVDVRFFPVYSYLIVYQPQTMPLRVVAILHGARDVKGILDRRA